MNIEILMATYNGEKYIKEQIESIINQSYPYWTLLIRDDGSKDNTINIIEKYEKKDRRIKVLKDNKGNLGFVKNFEELIMNSSKEFIMFSDQDDYWLENKIKNYILELKKLDSRDFLNPLLVHSNSYICNDKLEIKKKEFVNSKIAVEYNKNSYFFNYFVQGSTVLINRKMIKIGLPFLESVELHDRYFHLLSEFFGKRIFINKSLMKYRQHESNEIGAKGNIIKKIIEKRYFDNNDRKLIEKLKEKYENSLGNEKIKEIDDYLNITDRKINRFKRIYESRKFIMNIKKRIFLILKG